MRFVLILSLIAGIGCGSEPLRTPRSTVTDQELRVLVPAPFGETYRAVFDGLSRDGWEPFERQRDAFFARLDGRKEGRSVRVRVKRLQDGNSLVGLRLEPVALDEELSALLPVILGRLEPKDAPAGPDDPFADP